MENSGPKFEKITTGNGFQNDLIATSNNRMEMVVVELDKLRTTVNILQEVIVEQNNKNSKLQQKVFWLTFISLLLTITQLVQVIDTIVSWSKSD